MDIEDSGGSSADGPTAPGQPEKVDAARQAAAKAYQAATVAEQNLQSAHAAHAAASSAAATVGLPAPVTPTTLGAPAVTATADLEPPAGQGKRTNRHDRALKEGAKRLLAVQEGRTTWDAIRTERAEKRGSKAGGSRRHAEWACPRCFKTNWFRLSTCRECMRDRDGSEWVYPPRSASAVTPGTFPEDPYFYHAAVAADPQVATASHPKYQPPEQPATATKGQQRQQQQQHSRPVDRQPPWVHWGPSSPPGPQAPDPFAQHMQRCAADLLAAPPPSGAGGSTSGLARPPMPGFGFVPQTPRSKFPFSPLRLVPATALPLHPFLRLRRLWSLRELLRSSMGTLRAHTSPPPQSGPTLL